MPIKLIRKCAKCPLILQDNEKALCLNCKELSKQKAKDRRTNRIVNGLCTKCGVNQPTIGKLCIGCAPLQRAAIKKTYHKHRKFGECVKCGSQAAPGNSLCTNHLKEASKLRRNNFILHGLCRCGKYKPLPNRKHCQHCSDVFQRYQRKLKSEIISHYSPSPPHCNCCGETNIEFLTIDHIDGNGAAHRRELNGKKFYNWLRNNNYPDGYQVLCVNCNFAKGANGECPHIRCKTYSPFVFIS